MTSSPTRTKAKVVKARGNKEALNEIDEYIKAGRLGGKKLDHYRMLEEICELVENDFCADMEVQEKYSQEDAKKMTEILGQVYLIAHCIGCRACQHRFSLPRELNRKRTK